MAVGPGALPEFLPVSGVRIGIASAGIKKPGRKDVVVFELADGANTAGVFTKNQFCAAPVVLAKQHLSVKAPRYLLINTGNANAGTGAKGLQDADVCCQSLADEAGCEKSQVIPFSTGVIGEPLPVNKIQSALPSALNNLADNHWPDAAAGIMTTDTRPKGATAEVLVGGKPVRISGISKGAGMIRPNMATMLAFVATDAPVHQEVLQQLLREAVEQSFNRITIDSDTSTNDACILVATGKADVAAMTDLNQPDWQEFRRVLQQLMKELAHAIIRDGEGATKFVEVRVEQAGTTQEALDVAYTIAHSPLVKTALFASDPNWGRILAAVGRAGIADLDVDKIDIYLNDVCIVENGCRASAYTEEAGQSVMNQEEILIRVVLRRGSVADQVWTTDLSHEYVRINAEYRT
ncbi:bifunctional ornithine acetyltransferase/N-acetylglutamate synthase [Hahella sp. CCB-MM4]|uniref:bifunctional glutamate N-acetyltransferase/amino-acid acetyltransferase ArgJ n=1 Tax=Hahella sp. (strain CCB-MM4) TaxID=1926491 RepID=UPI000B9A8E3B|nr:bifunctional glutamate N-acetyltransferase/amino-acid acetyltransferase ArgJ [Hahella sp. CCB-MM4]OZG71978.1 bifunctional ornithine acetyltransferase/N-acetylglutamate synthase [Hahella sp. CCB-MM4]